MLGRDADEVVAPCAARFAATPRIARLLLSVAPLVKTISFGRGPDRPRRSTPGPRRPPPWPAQPKRVRWCWPALPIGLGEVGQHRLDHAGIDPRGGVVVHVDRRDLAHRSPGLTGDRSRSAQDALAILTSLSTLPNRPSCRSATRSRSRPGRPGFRRRAEAALDDVRLSRAGRRAARRRTGGRRPGGRGPLRSGRR